MDVNKEVQEMNAIKTQGNDTAIALRAGITEKYLTFQLAEEEYGLEILKVHEIIGLMNITHVPKMPDFVKGVINLRGKIIPVVDIRLKFGMDFNNYNERTCIIVVQIYAERGMIVMGIIVDKVLEVLDISPDQIEDTPVFGTNVNTEFILGVGKVGQRVVMLLDIDKVLSADELMTVSSGF